MPSRILREGILSSESVTSTSKLAELFYRCLMSVVDDYGRYYGHPSILRTNCFPMRLDDVKDGEISGWLDECVKAELLTTYTVKGCKYLEINNFNQRTRSDSKFPAPCPRDDGHDDGHDDRKLPALGEGEGVSRNAVCEGGRRTPTTSPWDDPDEIAYLQVRMLEMMPGDGWQPPDHDIVKQTLRAAGGASATEVNNAIELMRKDGKRPQKSYGWFPKMVKEFYRGRA